MCPKRTAHRREITRLQHKALMLKSEWERTTGKHLESTPEDRQRQAEKAAGIIPDILSARSACSTLQSWLHQIKRPTRQKIISAQLPN
jgi:hypothetical protein